MKCNNVSRKDILTTIQGYGIESEDEDQLIDDIELLINKGYDEGMVDGALEYEEDNPPINEEKSNSEFVTERFAGCKNFEDFTTIYNEIRNLSYTYM